MHERPGGKKRRLKRMPKATFPTGLPFLRGPCVVAKTKISDDIRPIWWWETGLHEQRSGPHLYDAVRTLGNSVLFLVSWD
eukprot:4721712-Pyramimonas_sp.AAC.1